MVYDPRYPSRQQPTSPAPYDPRTDPRQQPRPPAPPQPMGSAAPAANPSNPNNVVPPNPLAGIDDAIRKQQSQKPAQPISLQSGQHFNPTTAPFGFDMTGPGVREQMWNNNQGLWFDTPGIDWVDQQLPQFQDPWAYEQWVDQNASSMGGPSNTSQYWAGLSGGMNMPNNSQTAFDMTKSRIPQSFQPEFDVFYDRMKDKVMSDVNSQSAARGVYGSNSALNNSIGAGLDVEADRAKAHTDFLFKDSENQRGWLSELGTQGRNADLTGLDRTKTLSDVAFRADSADLARDQLEGDLRRTADDARAGRLGAGVSTAFASDAARQGRLGDAFKFAGQGQDARENRINTLYNQNTGFSNDVVDFLGENFDKLLGGDTQMSDSELQSMIAQAADQRGWDDQTQERMFRDISKALEIIMDKKAAATAATGGAGG